MQQKSVKDRLNFYFVWENGKFAVKQHVTFQDGTRGQRRVPRKHYKQFKTKEALRGYVDRLNYGLDMAKQREAEIKSAFIPDSVIESFRVNLQSEIPNQKDFRYLYNTQFKKYFWGYFVDHLGILDPLNWPKKQSGWGQALTSKTRKIFDKPISAKTIKGIVQVANRFMLHLHVQMPQVYPMIKLQPLSRGALKTYAAEQALARDPEPIGQYITDTDWLKISAKIPPNIRHFVNLMYYYGLRRAEALGYTQTDDVKNGGLAVRKQLKANPAEDPVYGPVKDRDQRLTPHWFAMPQEAFQWVSESMAPDKKMHPDHLSTLWEELMEQLELPYHLHDLRRTFITRALRAHPARDVQLAVGHASLATTMKYAQDDRDLDDKPFRPAG